MNRKTELSSTILLILAPGSELCEALPSESDETTLNFMEPHFLLS
ncbi:MAG: hypothetical protein QGE97_05125 [SAR324 cluster bacterium]|nr:hypothetical protein [SAR324 cluster bacterium]